MENRTSVRSYDITPMAKPRLNRGSRFSAKAKRYYAWRDMVRLLGATVPVAGGLGLFTVPMPASWSKAKKELMAGKAHQQVPDVDNYAKAFL